MKAFIPHLNRRVPALLTNVASRTGRSLSSQHVKILALMIAFASSLVAQTAPPAAGVPTYPAQVAVELFTDKLGTSSVVIGHRIVAADGTVHCDGQVVAVWVDRQTGKPAPLPPGVRRASERLLPAA